MEYMTDPKRINGQYQVHEYLREPLFAWIRWARIRSKRSYSLAEKQYAKREYYTAKHHAKYRFSVQSKKSIINEGRKTQNQSAKL